MSVFIFDFGVGEKTVTGKIKAALGVIADCESEFGDRDPLPERKRVTRRLASEDATSRIDCGEAEEKIDSGESHHLVNATRC